MGLRKAAHTKDSPAHTIDAVVFCGDTTLIYRARRKADDLPVILKTLKDGRVAGAVALLTHEYEMARRIDGPNVIRAISMAQHNNVPVIELEDVGGDSLDNIAKQRRLPPVQVLHIAIQLARGLADIHAADIIHKDINPSNVVYNAETGVVKIIDFGVSTILPREQAILAGAESFEGTLPYISPEQTGRMNRPIDYRTDFYSFGATLYELLTGRTLFNVAEPIEWFHSHIAKQPAPVADVDPCVPGPICDIVMKLLAKNAEDRYQSAGGIEADLQHCLDELSGNGRIEPFALARRDLSERFQIPQRLYGRENEVARLLAGFDRVANGDSKMILISGYSGIGKTRLVKEIYKPVTEHRGYFASGKFDQLHRNIPYSAIAAALRDLVRQLLAESDSALVRWREKILKAVGANGQLIIDIIRELELIIGPQPAIPDVPPVEAEQRFYLTLQRFAYVFCGPEHPLVLFLDDLQWIDSASMRMLDLLSRGESGATHLLFIGAYRENKVQAGHPVALWLEELNQRNVDLEQIRLRPLDDEHLIDLLSDTLGADRGSVVCLAEVVKHKTGGNPFFVEEFLKVLHQSGLIEFVPAKHRWTWDIEKIRTRQVTDNLVDLMTIKLKRLTPATLDLLKLGACFGFRFSLGELSEVSEQPPVVVAEKLREGICEGLITPMGDAARFLSLSSANDAPGKTVAFVFAHDRIHQAAYMLLDNAQRDQAHYRIGRMLQDRLPPAGQDEMLFQITNHLNLAMPLIAEPQERHALCRLNLKAGQRAISANAYQPAFDYLKTALHLAGETIWDHDYALALDLYSEAAQAAYLAGDYDEMDRLLSVGFKRARQLLDKVKLYQVRMAACMARGQLLEAINTAKPLLAELGHHFPARPKKWHAIVKLLRLKWRLRRTSIDDLQKLPDMTDPYQLATLNIGERIGSAAMFAQPELLPLLIMHAVGLVADYGHTPKALSIIAAYGMILAESLGEVDRGQAFGRLALALTERMQAKAATGRVLHIYNAMVRHWKEPLRNSIAPLYDAFVACLENGDFEYAAHAGVMRLFYAYESGMELNQLFSELQSCQTAMNPLKQGPRIWYLGSELQKVDNLLGNSADPSQLNGRYYNVDKMMPLYEQFGDNSLMFTDCLNQIRLNYLFGHHEKALELSGRRKPGLSSGLQGMYTSVSYHFLDSLIRLAVYPGSSNSVRRRLMRQVGRNQRLLKRWAKNNPDNCLNKVYLVQAEKLHVLCRDFDAHKMFDNAIRMAREQDFIHEEALANELCGIMHLNAKRMSLGEPYLARARDLYRQWGAEAKARHMEQHYPQIIGKAKNLISTTTTWGTPHTALDMGSLIKGLKAIAEETVHSRMVGSIIETALEFAGAQKGILILRNPSGVLCIEAESSVDSNETSILQAIPATQADLSQAVVNYVSRTGTSVVIHDAQQPNNQIPGLNQDSYIRAKRIRSILCLPILARRQGKNVLIGMLYLENNRTGGAFTQERFDTLEIICLSAAGRLELSRKAILDGLTGLHNHNYFQNILKQEFLSAKRYHRTLALIMIDIDHFKRFNDTWGHQVGDQVLREVARVIKSSCRSEDTVARYGGEEMAVILPLTDAKEAEGVAERIRSAIEKLRIAHDNEDLTVTISLGLVVLDETIADKQTLIRCADTALYRSKERGRNRVTVYSAVIN